MSTHALPEEDLLYALSLIVASHASGRPTTGRQLARLLGRSADAGMRRRNVLAERGLIQLVEAPNGAVRLHPTAEALTLPLPTVRLPQLEEPPRKTTRRPCMKCRDSFQSDGPHHRHCNRCRRVLADLSAGAGMAF